MASERLTPALTSLKFTGRLSAHLNHALGSWLGMSLQRIKLSLAPSGDGQTDDETDADAVQYASDKLWWLLKRPPTLQRLQLGGYKIVPDGMVEELLRYDISLSSLSLGTLHQDSATLMRCS